jgi:hypothetical protein
MNYFSFIYLTIFFVTGAGVIGGMDNNPEEASNHAHKKARVKSKLDSAEEIKDKLTALKIMLVKQQQRNTESIDLCEEILKNLETCNSVTPCNSPRASAEHRTNTATSANPLDAAVLVRLLNPTCQEIPCVTIATSPKQENKNPWSCSNDLI